MDNNRPEPNYPPPAYFYGYPSGPLDRVISLFVHLLVASMCLGIIVVCTYIVGKEVIKAISQ